MKNYIVISLRELGMEKHFKGLIDCDYYTILRYAESLTFDADITLCFYPLEGLNTVSFVRGLPSDTVVMNNEKSLASFKTELLEKLDELDIKELEESTKDE